MSSRVTVVHPPMTIARDFIDYPHVSNLGAVQLAGSLRDAGHDVRLVDAFALPSSTLRWDDRAYLGAPVEDVLERIDGDVCVVAYSPFHRPPHRDPVLASLLSGIRASRIILADAYQSGQHYVESSGVLDAYPEAHAWVKYESEATVDALLRDFQPGVHVGVRPELSSLALPAWDLVDRDAYWQFHRRFEKGLGRAPGAFPLGAHTLPLVTTRGCPFTCIHCSSNPDRDQPHRVHYEREQDTLRIRLENRDGGGASACIELPCEACHP